MIPVNLTHINQSTLLHAPGITTHASSKSKFIEINLFV